jgi:hypothetical protein
MDMQAVVELPGFVAVVRGAGLSEDEAQRIVGRIAAAPAAGDLIPGAGGARSVRRTRQGQERRLSADHVLQRS